MKLYKKLQNGSYALIEDYQSVNIGDLVKVFSTKKNSFITKHVYFVIKKDESEITLNKNDSNFVFNYLKETLSFSIS